MYKSQMRWRSRTKLVGGACCRLWGRLTRNPDVEFHGDQLIVAGKLEAYYARSGVRALPKLRAMRTGGFSERRRSFHVVA